MIARINAYLRRALFEESPRWVYYLSSAILCALLGVGLGIFSALCFASERNLLFPGILSAICMAVMFVGVIYLYDEYKAENRRGKLRQHADHLNNLAAMLYDALSDEMRVYAIDGEGIPHLVVADPENEHFFSFFSVDSDGELFHFSLLEELCENVDFIDPNSDTCGYAYCDKLFAKVYHQTRNQALMYSIDAIVE